jgi:mannose-6-phosphate isomerase-like protein (cupin superfamily)
MIPWALAAVLTLGWASREIVHAAEKADLVPSQTITLDQVTMKEASFDGKRTGMIGFYVQGDTPASAQFVTGRFAIDAGKTPHPPHTHIEEEVMVVESGQGEIFCDGKTTKVGPGSVMYTAPNAPHGITNTGSTPLAFYFVKWSGKSGAGRTAR